jgi:uncharacterized membrane protein
MTKISTIALATSVAGALALAAGTAAAQYKGPLKDKCYGVSKAGQNDCANAAKTHSCQGQSKVDFDLGEWKAVASKADCDKLGGAFNQPGKGVNKNVKM